MQQMSFDALKKFLGIYGFPFFKVEINEDLKVLGVLNNKDLAPVQGRTESRVAHYFKMLQILWVIQRE